MAIGGNVTMPLHSILYLTLITTLLTGCGMIFPRVYSSQSIEGWVVDSETGEPLKDVVVVADWTIWGGLEGGSPKDHIVHEVVTDATGHYYIPAWGPKQMPTTGSFQSVDPQLIFFRENYEFFVESNEATATGGYLGYSKWNGKTIKLKQFQGDLRAYGKHQSNLNDRIGHIAEDGDGCGWQNIPRLLVAVTQQNQLFKGEGKKYLPPLNYLLFSNSLDSDGYIFRHNDFFTKKCGKSPKQFFKDYLDEHKTM